jgi:PKD repeat protein
MASAVRGVLVALLGVAMLGAGAATASAVIVHVPSGKTLSYQPLPGLRTFSPFDKLFNNLDYNGGPVMTSNTNYVIYWSPSGAAAYPPGYESGVNQYFEDLAHDSGGTQNVESVSAQYNDAAGDFASYNSHFGGAFIDTGPYPENGCTLAGIEICLTDEQLREELTRFVKAQGLQTDLAHEYFLLTPSGVEDCFEASGLECSAGAPEGVAAYCAYHGNVPLGAEGELIYSNDPYVTGNEGCDDNNHPNGTPSDGVIEGGLSHEHNESITDPEPNNAWTDIGGSGGENGDKCRTFEATEFGSPLGKAPNGAMYNQVINGHLYWYQQEWSNQSKQCLQRLTFSGAEPTATFTSTNGTGTKMTFDATGSTAPGGVTRYNWQFNDGPGNTLSTPVETSSPTVSHTFPKSGAYLVALTVFANDGTSIGSAGGIATGDEGPAGAFSVTTASPTAGQAVSFNGSASTDPDGSIASYSWNFGDGSPAGTGPAPSHTYAALGTYMATLTVEDISGQTATNSHPVVVGKGSQVITLISTAPASATVGGPAYQVAATASSGLPVAFSSGTASVCSVSGSTVSFIAAGTCTIDANQAGSADFAAAPQVQQSFSVATTPASAPAVIVTSTLTAKLTPTIAPNSNFSILGATFNPATGTITFPGSVGDPGTFSWLLTFQNGRFGVFGAIRATCKKGFVRLKGRCRPSKIVFARGSKTVANAGTVTFRVKPSTPALKALKNALKQKKGLPVTVKLTFQSSRGGSPVSHTQSLTVRLKKT